MNRGPLLLEFCKQQVHFYLKSRDSFLFKKHSWSRKDLDGMWKLSCLDRFWQFRLVNFLCSSPLSNISQGRLASQSIRLRTVLGTIPASALHLIFDDPQRSGLCPLSLGQTKSMMLILSGLVWEHSNWTFGQYFASLFISTSDLENRLQKFTEYLHLHGNRATLRPIEGPATVQGNSTSMIDRRKECLQELVNLVDLQIHCDGWNQLDNTREHHRWTAAFTQANAPWNRTEFWSSSSGDYNILSNSPYFSLFTLLIDECVNRQEK